MRVHRFFIKKIVSGNEIRIDEENVIHQMRDVFRLKKGDKARLLDNTGNEYETVIQLLTREEGVFHIEGKVGHSFTPKTRLHLMSALTKKTFEVVLEKGTELGVSEFTPLISERTEKQNINRERAERIIEESAEQSGKVVLPILNDPRTLEDLLKQDTKDLIVFDLVGTAFNLQFFSGRERVTVLIGPEGGWSDGERKMFVDLNVPVYSFGPQIMRAETAAIVAATLFLV